jgi:hypothetical protein
MTKIALKSWLAFEAARLGISIQGVFVRFQRGKYPGITKVHENARVVNVLVPDGLPAPASAPVAVKRVVPVRPVRVRPAARCRSKFEHPREKLEICGCGRLCKNEIAGCDRCQAIEQNHSQNFHWADGGVRDVNAKYAARFGMAV